MSKRFTQAFRLQAVEKVLSRRHGVPFRAVADTLGVAYSTLYRWTLEAKTPALNALNEDTSMTAHHEKKPQDWSTEERFQMIVHCASLDSEGINQHCRENGIYPHHVTQWRQDFLAMNTKNPIKDDALELKKLKLEFGVVKKDLHRKNRALAEAAALLVLQKKVNALWGNDEEDSP